MNVCTRMQTLNLTNFIIKIYKYFDTLNKEHYKTSLLSSIIFSLSVEEIFMSSWTQRNTRCVPVQPSSAPGLIRA